MVEEPVDLGRPNLLFESDRLEPEQRIVLQVHPRQAPIQERPASSFLDGQALLLRHFGEEIILPFSQLRLDHLLSRQDL